MASMMTSARIAPWPRGSGLSHAAVSGAVGRGWGEDRATVVVGHSHPERWWAPPPPVKEAVESWWVLAGSGATPRSGSSLAGASPLGCPAWSVEIVGGYRCYFPWEGRRSVIRVPLQPRSAAV